MLLASLCLSFAIQDPSPGEPPPAAEPASIEITTAVERLDLGNGCTLQGRVLRETEQTVFLDVGYDVLKVPVAAVVRREGVDGKATGNIRRETLFAEAELPERSVAEGAKLFGEAVVKIEAAGGQGSGFLVHPDGWIVTNFHVVEREVEVDVVVFNVGKDGFEPRTIKKCRVDAINPAMDLALVKMTPPKDLQLKTVYLGDSNAMQTGDRVYAIGTPIGLDRTVSSGIISVTNRVFQGRCHFQITVPINPGNSGGPLFNLRGEVVGVNSSGYTGFQGLNFAIQSKYVKDFLINRDAFALDSTRSENGVHFLPAPKKPGSDGKPVK
ncbi:MAG: trypsin-like peptidase domain-containing protein [Planctomycetes bacterium]|nr:trypsin-like peptidase domain-containing protein [Planctomycetota bacterium]